MRFLFLLAVFLLVEKLTIQLICTKSLKISLILKKDLCKLHLVLALTYPILHFNGYLLLLIRYGHAHVIYMAMSDEDLTGVSIPKCGRPSLGEKICRIAYEKVFITDG